MGTTREETEEVEGLEQEIEMLLSEVDKLDEEVDLYRDKLDEVAKWFKTHKKELPKLAAKQLESILTVTE